MYVVCIVIDRFGIACERTRLPHLQGEPFVLSDAQGKAAVRAVSDEAARFGVAVGQAVSGARSLCPNLIVLPYDKTAYEAAAASVWNALSALSDTVEPVSPEVAFLLLSSRHAESDAAQLAAKLSHAVGVPVQIGIGRSKLIAERAARATTDDKGSGPILVTVGEEVALLASIPVSRVAELPRRVIGKIKMDRPLVLRLERLGVKILGDMLSLPLERLPRVLRPTGQLLRDLVYGIDRDPVRPLWPLRTITEEVRFDDEEAVQDRFLAERALQPLASKIACALSSSSDFCRTLTVRVGLLDNTYIEAQDRFVVPLSHAADLQRHAVRLLSKLSIDQPITSLSIVAGEIAPGSGAQLALNPLEGAPTMPAEVRRVRLEATLDFLRREFGLRAVLTGQQMYQSRRSVQYGAQPLGHLLADPVRVVTNASGQPVRYWRRRKGEQEESSYSVRRIADRWRESKWRADLSVTDTEVWRIETDPYGIGDLKRIGAQWQIAAMMD